MISKIIQTVLAGKDPEPAALEDALHQIMLGDADPAQTAGLLVALATRPPRAENLAAAARVLRSHCVKVLPNVRPLIDTCGTGGDGSSTFNISTATAMLLAACGNAVAKHGNRAVSSKVGSADVLEAAGCKLELSAQAARDLLDATGFVFLFAPAFHPAMAHVAPVRRALGVRTLFNLLGPLVNPADAEYQILGVYDPADCQVVAEALQELGSRGALVVHCEGMDEIGLHGVTHGCRLQDGRLQPFTLKPEDLGLERTPLSALAGGDVEKNAQLLQESLTGKAGPLSDVVALNTAAALMVAGKVPDLPTGLEEARASMQSGAASRILSRYAESSSRMAGRGA